MPAHWDRDPSAKGPVVQAISAGGFAVDGGIYRGLLLTPQSAHEWQAPPLAALTVGDLAPLLELQPQPEFLLLGTGERISFPSRDLRERLDALGIGIEAMDSRAAARTWGLLRSEERWIAAAIMPLG